MSKLHNKVFVIFCISFLIQSCSFGGIVFGGGDKKRAATIGATENRRIPEQNPIIEEEEETAVVQNNPSVQYLDDDDQQSYQDYRANSPPKDFSKFRKEQREAELKAYRLNQSMDKEASAFKESQAENNPMQIDGQSSLNEIIEYNKNKKTKNTSKSSELNKETQNNKQFKEESNKNSSSKEVKSSSENGNNKEVSVVTLKSNEELSSSSKSKSKSKKSVKKSDSVKSKKQNKSSSDKKHKISVKPVIGKKLTVKKDSAAKKSKTLETLESLESPTDKTEASADSKKLTKDPVSPVANKTKTTKKAAEMEEVAKKDKAIKTKTDTSVKVPEILNDPVIDTPLLTNKAEYNDVSTTYLVVDPSEVMGNSATAEKFDIGEETLVNPFVEDDSKKENPKADIRNLSHEEFKKALKEKFKKDNEGKHVDETEMDNMSSIEIIDDNTDKK